MPQQIFVGIDGGATKTIGILCDGRGCRLAFCHSARSAITGRPTPEVLAVLAGTLDDLCQQARVPKGRIALCGLGLNGVDFADEHADQHASVAEALGLSPERVILVNDGVIALWGATARPTAAILQHGTGLTAAYRRRLGAETLFDHLNVGGQFDIRHELVRQVARMTDRRTEVTSLMQSVLHHFGIEDASRFCECVWRRRVPRALLLSTPPLIFQAWLENDPVATRLVEGAIQDYALTARTMVTRIGDPAADMAFGGGVLRHAPEPFWRRMRQALQAQCPGVAIREPALPPEAGAVVMAAFHAGQDVPRFFECMARHYQELILRESSGCCRGKG